MLDLPTKRDLNADYDEDSCYKILTKLELPYFSFLNHVVHKMRQWYIFRVFIGKQYVTIITALTLTPAEVASDICYCLTSFQMIRTERKCRELFSVAVNLNRRDTKCLLYRRERIE